jgi:hypothetical protein
MRTLVLLAMLTCAEMADAQICFSPVTNYTTGAGTASVISADFNGDGKVDLATASSGSGNISILTGDGSGNFSLLNNYSAGSGPYSLCVGDFNGDSKVDLAVANHNSNNVSFMAGNGAGGFGVVVNFTVGTGPSSIVSADFNGDGLNDLVTANFTSNNISVLLGNGAGSFASATNFSIGNISPLPNPHAVICGDFNADGKADLATANYSSNNLSVLTGDGSGNFSVDSIYTIANNSAPYSLIGTDLNNDGETDLAVINTSANNMCVLLGITAGKFGPATYFPIGSPSNATSPSGITYGDFNGDGKTDIAVANESTDNIYVLLGNGTGNYTVTGIFPLLAGSNANAIISADFNGDGKPDLATANWSLGSASVLLNAPLSVITIKNSASAVCPGKKDTLTATGASTYVWAPPYSGNNLVVNGVGFVPASTNTYTVIATNQYGCTNKAVKTITVYPLPSITVTPTANPVCSGQHCTLNASGAISYTATGGITIGTAFTPSVTSTYTISGTDANGCTNKSVKTLTVSPLPTVVATPVRDTICAGDSTMIIASGAVTYTWSSTATGTKDSITVKPVFNTIYMVTGANTDGCKNTAIAIITVNCAVGINGFNEFGTAIKIYPNPVADILNIESGVQNEMTDVKISDVIGKEVLNKRSMVSSKTVKMDVSNLPEGVYLLEVKTPQRGFTGKIIIQH